MKRFSPLLLLALVACVPIALYGQLYHATVKPPNVRESAVELRNAFSVLAIAMAPGDEDFSLLAELRRRRGAKIVTAYATNGEAGESDVSLGYPGGLAAALREEATQSMETIGAEAYFLNLPDVGAVRDAKSVDHVWNRDTVTIRLMKLISLERPHLVILFPERESRNPSLTWEFLKDRLVDGVRRLRPATSVKQLSRSYGISSWSVQRIVVGSLEPAKKGGGRSLSAAVRADHKYSSLGVQLSAYHDHWTVRYEETFPSVRRIRTVDAGLPHRVGNVLRSLSGKIRTVADALRKRLTKSRKAALLSTVSALNDSVSILISTRYSSLSTADQKTLLLWKETLENIKNDLLGVSISFSLSEQTITHRQLTYLRIDSVGGASAKDNLWLYFPGVKEGWIFNETAQERLPLKQGEQFRLVSPQVVPYNIPPDLDGLDKNRTYTPINVYVLRSTKDRERTFVLKVPLPFHFAPKFTVELLTPVVRAVDNDVVVVRLTNHSRDGVRSQIEAADSLVSSTSGPFRLNQKEESATDTLRLSWKPVEEGTHLVKLKIEGIPVARFAARAFDVSVDTSRRVGLITTFNGGATGETLRRLGVHWDSRLPGDVSSAWLSLHDVILLDRRVLSLSPELRNHFQDFSTYVEGGGRIVILAQDDSAWNEDPFIAGIHLNRSSSLDAEAVVAEDSSDGLLARPNRIGKEDWVGWLWYRAYNSITVDRKDLATPMSDRSTGSPFVVREIRGKGTVTYVDLALPPQWLNINIGSFRLLANLVSY